MVVTCEQVWREVSNYHDGEVSLDLRAAMEEHFRGCQKCSANRDCPSGAPNCNKFGLPPQDGYCDL